MNLLDHITRPRPEAQNRPSVDLISHRPLDAPGTIKRGAEFSRAHAQDLYFYAGPRSTAHLSQLSRAGAAACQCAWIQQLAAKPLNCNTLPL